MRKGIPESLSPLNEHGYVCSMVIRAICTKGSLPTLGSSDFSASSRLDVPATCAKTGHLVISHATQTLSPTRNHPMISRHCSHRYTGSNPYLSNSTPRSGTYGRQSPMLPHRPGDERRLPLLHWSTTADWHSQISATGTLTHCSRESSSSIPPNPGPPPWFRRVCCTAGRRPLGHRRNETCG